MWIGGWLATFGRTWYHEDRFFRNGLVLICKTTRCHVVCHRTLDFQRCENITSQRLVSSPCLLLSALRHSAPAVYINLMESQRFYSQSVTDCFRCSSVTLEIHRIEKVPYYRCRTWWSECVVTCTKFPYHIVYNLRFFLFKTQFVS